MGKFPNFRPCRRPPGHRFKQIAAAVAAGFVLALLIPRCLLLIILALAAIIFLFVMF